MTPVSMFAVCLSHLPFNFSKMQRGHLQISPLWCHNGYRCLTDTSPRLVTIYAARRLLLCLPLCSYLELFHIEHVFPACHVCVMDGPLYFTDSDQTLNLYTQEANIELTQTIKCAGLLHVSVMFSDKSRVFMRSPESSKSADEASMSTKLQLLCIFCYKIPFQYYKYKWNTFWSFPPQKRVIVHFLGWLTGEANKSPLIGWSQPKQLSCVIRTWLIEEGLMWLSEERSLPTIWRSCPRCSWPGWSAARHSVFHCWGAASFSPVSGRLLH